MSQASREREKQRSEAKAKAAAELPKPAPKNPARPRNPIEKPFVVTEEMRAARKRLLAKVESVKDLPGPKILGVSFSRATNEPRIKFFGARSIEAFHAKYDPELKNFIEICRAQQVAT